MMYLGGYYYEQRQFDLALKYYEMAAECDYDKAYDGLAYIWYYGRTGTKDYKLAFEYFHKLMDKGNLVAMYKIADMYRNGYYVEKSTEKYTQHTRVVTYTDGKILVRHVNAYVDKRIRIYVARQIEKASLKNMLSLVKYYLKK